MNHRLSEIWLIFTKELLDLYKDRVIILLTVILPIVIYPVILGGVNKLVTVQFDKLKDTKVNVAVTGPGDWFIPFLQDEERFNFIDQVDSPLQLLQSGTIHLWLDFVPTDDIRTAGMVIINYSAADELSGGALRKMKDVLEWSMIKHISQQFTTAGVSWSTHDALRIEEIDQSTDRDKSGYLAGKIVPILMILMILSGASFAAVDLISGEKERGTLETLLLAPVSRRSIIWGKFLVVFIIACISAVVNLLGIYITLSFHMIEIPLMEGVTFSLGWFEVLLMLLFTLPMSVIFSALLIIIASYADTFKEGQYYVLPFVLFGIVPGLPALLPHIELNSVICIVPISSLAVALKEVLTGTYNWTGLSLAFLSNTLYAVLALRFASHALDRETILPGTQTVMYDRDQSLQKNIAILFITVFLLVYFLGTIVQRQDAIIGIWLTQLVLIALPAIVFLKLFNLPLAEYLKIKPFTGRHMMGALCLEGGTFLTVLAFMVLQNKFLPVPHSLEEHFSDFFTRTGYPLWVNIVTFGVSAGLCEEILFRGTVTSVLSRSLKRWQVILVVGFLFGIMHFSIYRILPTAVIGIVYTYIVVKTNSIFPTMILHALHNMTAMYMMSSDSTVFLDLQNEFFTPHGLVLTVVLFLLGWLLLRNHK